MNSSTAEGRPVTEDSRTPATLGVNGMRRATVRHMERTMPAVNSKIPSDFTLSLRLCSYVTWIIEGPLVPGHTVSTQCIAVDSNYRTVLLVELQLKEDLLFPVTLLYHRGKQSNRCLRRQGDIDLARGGVTHENQASKLR